MKYTVIYIDEFLDINMPVIALVTDNIEEAKRKLNELNAINAYCWIAEEIVE